MQHTKEVLTTTDYNLEEALISTYQCLARLIVTFLVKPSLTLTGKPINDMYTVFLFLLLDKLVLVNTAWQETQISIEKNKFTLKV